MDRKLEYVKEIGIGNMNMILQIWKQQSKAVDIGHKRQNKIELASYY